MEQGIDAAVVILRGLIRMVDVIITFKIMPSGVDIDMNKLKTNVGKEILGFKGRIVREEIEPVAFGIKALKITFAYEENRGGTDSLEARIIKIKGVESVDVIDVRRAIG